MNPYLHKVIELYEEHDIDLQSVIGWHLCYGIVISTPTVFALFFPSRSNEPEMAVVNEGADTLYATMCCGNMRDSLSLLKDQYAYVAFRRELKGSSRVRLLNMKKFYSKLK
jgi:hypothetical protein